MAVDPVHRLEIIEAVRVTKARYFRFIDQKRWDEFPTCSSRTSTSTPPTTGR